MSVELDTLFGPARKHVYERKEWVAVARVDDHHLAGAAPIDLEGGIVRLPRRPDPNAEAESGPAE